MSKAKQILEALNTVSTCNEDNNFTVGSFVYYKDGFVDGYGIIIDILDSGTCTVQFKYTKFGALLGITEDVSLKNLKDGNQMIDKQINKLQSQINTQEKIRKNCLQGER